MKAGYDVPTAITFLMVGLGAGAILAMLMKPRRYRIPETRNVASTKRGVEHLG
jgi:hypothetical protein